MEENLSSSGSQNGSKSILHQMEQRLEDATTTLNSLVQSAQRKVESASTDAEANIRSIIHKAEDRRDRLAERLKTYREASGNASEDLKAGVEMAWEDLKEAMRSASERFQS